MIFYGAILFVYVDFRYRCQRHRCYAVRLQCDALPLSMTLMVLCFLNAQYDIYDMMAQYDINKKRAYQMANTH